MPLKAFVFDILYKDGKSLIDEPLVKRMEILKIHSTNKPLKKDIDLRVIAERTPGFSGADLANLINEGALMAARLNQKMVTMRNIEDAKDKIMMGVERDWLESVYRRANEEHGSIDGYLRDVLGVDDHLRDRLRQALAED